MFVYICMYGHTSIGQLLVYDVNISNYCYKIIENVVKYFGWVYLISPFKAPRTNS